MENKTEKPIAISVLTMGQLRAIEKHYAAMDWVRSTICPMGGRSNPEKRLYHIITYGNRWLTIDESNIFATNQYDIIPFNAFSKLTGVVAEEAEIRIELKIDGNYALIKKDEIRLVSGNSLRHSLSISELTEIYTAYTSLS
jgi:hypothetical protein